MKKILFITLLFIYVSAFAQQTQEKNAVNQKTILKVTSSPNPFTDYTQIYFYNKKDQKVLLIVKNLLGKTVYTYRFNSKKGNNSIPFYRDGLVSGIYIYSIQTDEEIISKRLVIR
ncbi:MAG: T9SS type A sorting domain-containing protein [Flavobacteriaceae bacterium]|nr:T9SS type A sorting domain-containing protein [Flavobacteriaceae bacterium]